MCFITPLIPNPGTNPFPAATTPHITYSNLYYNPELAELQRENQRLQNELEVNRLKVENDKLRKQLKKGKK